MDAGDSSGEYWLGIDQTMDFQQDFSSRSWQNETIKTVANPIYLFGQFVSAVSSDSLKDITRPQSEVSQRLL
jgi:hypothetical protein